MRGQLNTAEDAQKGWVYTRVVGIFNGVLGMGIHIQNSMVV